MNRQMLQQLDWLQDDPPARKPAVRHRPPLPAARHHRLWFCLRFEDLALEVQAGYAADEPHAVWTSEQQGCRIHSASPAARTRGIEPGLSLSAAQALCPKLRLDARDKHAEQEQLQTLIALAGRYSAWIWPSEAGLLLELSSTQRLFGGPQSLTQRLLKDLQRRGHQAQHALATSARAAECLARWAPGAWADNLDRTRQAMYRLPSAALTTDPRLQRRLGRAGIRRVADLLRLPRQGLARRYGPDLLRTLDQALGREAEVIPAVNDPRHFSQSLDLPEPEHRVASLLAAADHLLTALIQALRTQDAAINRLDLQLYHASSPASLLRLAISQAGRDQALLKRQLALHLEALILPEPVLSLRLDAPQLLDYHGETDDWLQSKQEAEWRATLDIWHARLGPQCVRNLQANADHRPEHAWSLSPLTENTRSNWQPAAPRPYWLLPTPQALSPQQRQHLQTLSGPERIEQGWWDQADICRDYYVMQALSGARLWVYQDRRHQDWWLHGYFD